MKWLVCVSIFVIVVICASASQSSEFRERAAIYSRLTECDYHKNNEYNYTHFVELSTLKELQPDNLYARVPIYVIGPKDAHIILSTTNTPDRKRDFVYEFLLGGFGNTRAIIRKRIRNYTLKDVTYPSVISNLRPLKVLIEISKSGHIKVYTDNKAEPLIEAYDPFVLPVKYVSFASYQGTIVEFLYNCISDKTTQETNNDVRESTTVSDDLSVAPLDYLVKKCEIEETWELDYKHFHDLATLKNVIQSEEYLFKMNFFVYGDREVHVLLSADLYKLAAYEIVVGGWGDTRQVIRKTIEDDEIFEKVQIKDLISEEQQTRIMIQMTKDGLIEVFVGDFQYKPIIFVHDPKPVDVKFVSFASSDGTRVLFFYNCDGDKYALATQPKVLHPLYIAPIEHNEQVLSKKCTHVRAWEDKYLTTIKLDSIKNSKPDGFHVQIPVYVKGVRDAHILLTPNNSLDPKDGYEIVIGGWGNTRSIIRKYGEIVAKQNEFNVLNEFKPIKVIIELTQTGDLRVFADVNKSRPLLEFKDTQPISDLSTLSFTAYYRDLDFYYGCTA